MNFMLIAGLAESLINFRGPLIFALQAKGIRVHVAAPELPADNSIRRELEAMQVVVHDIPIMRTGTNPLADLRTLFALWRLMRNIKPDMVLSYTIKPVIYGSLAAWLAQVPQRFALITGLGYVFQGDGGRRIIQKLVHHLYKTALRRTHMVFFQNQDDLALFRERGILEAQHRAKVVNGSGVDIVKFPATPLPTGPMHFLLTARLLGDKGVREYAKAARMLKGSYPTVRFSLVGWIDSNPDAILPTELAEWMAEGSIEFLGRLSDVRPAIAACSVYVLPSYREGTPRTVLEAMAMGRPVITTDTPGCRETVIDDYNGVLIPAKSVEALASAMRRFLDYPELAACMGARARQMAEDKYDVHKVNVAMLDAMNIH